MGEWRLFYVAVSCVLMFGFLRGAERQEPKPLDISGIWQLVGQEGDDKYHGAILIEQQDDGSCKVATCTLDTMTRGIGIRKDRKSVV